MSSTPSEFLRRTLPVRHANRLRRLKWAILGRFADDRQAVLRLYRSEVELRVLEHVVRPGETVVDAGANIGGYAHHLSRYVGDAGRVVAFEPRSDVHRRLVRVLDGRRNCTLERLGLSDGERPAQLFLPASHGTSSVVHFDHFAGFGSETIRLVTLDGYLAGHGIEGLSFLKIDVEGHEFEVVHGAEATLRRDAPIVLCESENRHLEPQGRSVRQFFALARELGYEAHVIAAGRLIPVREVTIPGEPGAPERPYHYNFWLVPERRPERLRAVAAAVAALGRGRGAAVP